MEITSIEKQIKEIEDEIFNTQKNKATEHHIGKLKAKLAKLKADIEKRKSAGAKGKGFAVKKSGDATVGLIGYPNIGKSTLLNQITDAKSRVGDYDFTTLDAIPGMMKYKGAKIQIKFSSEKIVSFNLLSPKPLSAEIATVFHPRCFILFIFFCSSFSDTRSILLITTIPGTYILLETKTSINWSSLMFSLTTISALIKYSEEIDFISDSSKNVSFVVDVTLIPPFPVFLITISGFF